MEHSISLSRGLIFLMAVTSGFTVANVYINQTLLVSMAGTFHVTAAQAGMIATLAQIGYAAGNLLLVPLGDLFERRRFIVGLLFLVGVCSAASALAVSFSWLAVTNLLLGFFTIIPQILVPFAAGLANDKNRGKVLGNVAIGLVCGILGARVVSGAIDAQYGWRVMYWIACAAAVIIMLIIRFCFPKSKGTHAVGYGKLISSLFPLLIKEKALRKACVNQGFMFGAFSLFWTTLVFMVSEPPFSFGSQTAGTIGLVGIGGAFATSLIGRIIDQKGAAFANKLCMSFTLLSFVLLMAGRTSMLVIVLGALFITMGIQANQVACQAEIFQLSADMRSRLNGIFMVSTFLGGALGSYAGGAVWMLFHWNGVCILGMIMIGIAFSSRITINRAAKQSDIRREIEAGANK
ncbi:MFS transporter [Bacillus inaquosorum]|uniref:MFS transporter n=1 Tax=Bacillus inaquosorum TaxID=483913 RepID=UPI0022804500|nr:MFS transporter [Bacillus inaquosorum]MCY7905748.1 MFS transporter [Bacillus inaquosorum]MCY7930262.1 MFS transporter [Bacillus inaquosorum]MCY8768704.1 MFS transporter [Bacillus inaquosorum]MCY9050332.1 MFS transporter [Bacillus inaquosorum]